MSWNRPGHPPQSKQIVLRVCCHSHHGSNWGLEISQQARAIGVRLRSSMGTCDLEGLEVFDIELGQLLPALAIGIRGVKDWDSVRSR